VLFIDGGHGKVALMGMHTFEGEHYSNVGWFLNHKCEDANLVDMPVKIDEVDPHYYHVGFFAKVKSNPYKELTWVWYMSFSFQVLAS
jgi:hypothetical protein